MADDALTRKEAEMGRLKDWELLSTTDGRVWAQQFNLIFAELHEGTTLDEGWLIGWFANAIETGRSAGQRSLESVREEALEDIPNEVCAAGMAAWEDTFGSPYTRYAAIYRTMHAALQHAPARVAEDEKEE